MADNEDESILGTGVTVEAFGRKVTATANHLINETTGTAYQSAMTNIHRGMRRPGLQRSVFSLAGASPRDTLRSKLSTNEIQQRALSYIPDDMLANLPADEHSSYSLFQGFKATLPEDENGDDGATGNEKDHRKKHRRSTSQAQKLIKAHEEDESKMAGPAKLNKARREQSRANHKLEMLGIRKNMCSAEILEIDKKIANLQSMRSIVLERLADLEDDELKLELDISELDIRVEDMQDLVEEEEAAAASKVRTEREALSSAQGNAQSLDDDDGTTTPGAATPTTTEGTQGGEGFMSESIYGKLPVASPSNKAARRPKLGKRKSMPIRHGHFDPGTNIREIPAHNDSVTSLDFDAPFGTMVTAALDDTVRVWDLNSGRCLGLLEGHRASVRCLQVEDTLVATGSIDASIRLWDLGRIDTPTITEPGWTATDADGEEEGSATTSSVIHEPPSSSATADCEIFSLEAHVAEITALHFRGDTLVSGSADKTLRQWDLVKGRCVQTLDVLWAAAQSGTSATGSAGGSGTGKTASSGGGWRTAARQPDANADFVGALQCFDAALACGTADGMVRLWDLRSGQVSRSLVGHTAPVTCLQFDDMHLVTGSLDRSVRVWDLRTGSIFDAFAFEGPVTSMMFDARRIIAAAGESVVKVYDKADGRQWDCGAGTGSSIVERVRIRDGFMVEGRRDGTVGAWTC